MAKRGRPSKYNSIDLEQVEILAGYGLTEEQIANVLNIHRDTLNEYKRQKPEFSDILKRGKDKADSEVIKALFQRAIGYKHKDLYITQYQGRVIEKEIIKEYPPDVVACIFWLKNRQRDKWREKVEDNQNQDIIDLPKNVDDLTDEQVNELYERIINKK